MAAPNRISYGDTGFNTNTPATKTVAITYQIGDVIVVRSASEGPSEQPGLAVLSGETFVNQKLNTAANSCGGRIDALVATGSGTGVNVSLTSTAGQQWGFSVEVWRGSDGIGNSVEQHTATKTVALTPTAAHGAISWMVADFNADAVGSGTPTPTTTDFNQDLGTTYTVMMATLADQASAGAVSYGQTGGGSTGPFTILALEIKAGSAIGGPDLNVNAIGEPVIGGSTF